MCKIMSGNVDGNYQALEKICGDVNKILCSSNQNSAGSEKDAAGSTEVAAETEKDSSAPEVAEASDNARSAQVNDVDMEEAATETETETAGQEGKEGVIVLD